MDRRVDGVEKALVGVRGEVHGDLDARRDGLRHFDVEYGFAVRAVGRAGMVMPAIDRDAGDSRLANTESGKIVLEVGSAVAAAQFDDADALAVSGDAVGEVIQFGQLRGRVGNTRGVGLSPPSAKNWA